MNQSTRKALRFLLLLAASLVGARVTHAQTLTTLAPGTRIRLVLVDSLRQGPVSPARQILVGTLIRTTNDSVWLQPRGAAAFSVSRAAIRGARASRGVSRVRSAVTFGVGLGLTAVAFQLAKNDSHDDVFGVGGVAFGVGAVLGASSPFEQWRRVRR